MIKFCNTCGTPFVGPARQFCDDCNNKKRTMAIRAHRRVQWAIQKGFIPVLDGSISCVDCDSPASCYEHRDYLYPLFVQPTCHKCNIRRGYANFQDDGDVIDDVQPEPKGQNIDGLAMTPQEAIIKLRASGWTMAQIAAHVGMFRTNIYKVAGGVVPTYKNAVALIEMAKRGKKPPARKKC